MFGPTEYHLQNLSLIWSSDAAGEFEFCKTEAGTMVFLLGSSSTLSTVKICNLGWMLSFALENLPQRLEELAKINL